MLYVTDYLMDEMSHDEFTSVISVQALKAKERILKYMKRFEPCAFTSQPVYDKFTGEKKGDADNGRSDGTYMWYESEIYHFEKYNMRLKEDFINHVLEQT